MMHGPEKSDFAIVAAKPTNKAGRTGCGAGGAKGGGQRESGPAKHAPGTEPGKRVTGAGPHATGRGSAIAARIPEAGAGCVKWACPDLCGGRGVMRVPTAIILLMDQCPAEGALRHNKMHCHLNCLH